VRLEGARAERVNALSATAVRALDAYGGQQLWREASRVEATLSAGGLAFKLKGRRALNHDEVCVDLSRLFVRQASPTEGTTAVLDGHSVRIEDNSGNVIEARADPRSRFPYGRRAFRWDDLDMAYFAAYAAWNYFSLPRLLLREDIRWSESAAGVLYATFPREIPTHSRRQRFIFNTQTGLLRQHDYTAQVFGSWARAANIVQEHTTGTQSIPYASRRRVTPRAFGRPLPGPALVWIHVHDWRIK